MPYISASSGSFRTGTLLAQCSELISSDEEKGMIKLRQGLSLFAIAVFLAGTAGCASTEEKRATGQVVDDAALTGRVKVALVKAEGLDATKINVNTYRGEVILSGFVESQQMIDRAGSLARGVDGVRTVRNDLHLTPKR
jgi:osmotically-inducible protein OsmY